MENKQLFFGDNSDVEFLDYIKSNYSFFKCVIVSSKCDLNNNINLFNSICGAVNKYVFVELPDKVIENKLVNKLIKNQITDDVGLVVVIGNQVVANYVSTIFNNVAFVCTMPSISQINVKASIVVFNYNRVLNCTLHSFTGCIGEILAVYCFVLEQVFNACVYKHKVDSSALIKLEKCLFNLSNMPLSIVKSQFGKLYVCKLALEISKYINNNLFSSSIVNFAKNLCDNSHLNFGFGYALGYGSKIMFNAFNYVFNAKFINCKIGFNAYLRIKNFENCTSISPQFIECNLNNFYNQITNLFNSFNVVKNDFYNVFCIYKKMFVKLYNKFLNLQFDKGFSHLIMLKPQTIIEAFNKLPEQSESANFVTFLREFGFLNNL